jgi:hypothetical protein
MQLSVRDIRADRTHGTKICHAAKTKGTEMQLNERINLKKYRPERVHHTAKPTERYNSLCLPGECVENCAWRVE